MTRTVRWLAWAVGILFLIGAALQLVDFLNLYATPPVLPPNLNMVDMRLGQQDYRVAIWPIYFLGNLSFGLGFIALAGLGLALAAWLATGDPQRVVIQMTLGVAGILGVVGQLILIGATQATIDIAYCDCGFKETEVVSQIWAQMLANGASNWLINGAGVLAGIGVLAVASAFGRRMPTGWTIVSWLTAIGLFATVAVGIVGVGDDLGLYLFLLVTGVIVPIWAFWLGASLREAPEAIPDVGAG